MAPPATHVTALARLPRQAMMRNALGKSGEARSIAMAAVVRGGGWKITHLKVGFKILLLLNPAQ